MEPDVFGTALDLAAAIRTRTVSPTEAMEHVLARIDERNPALNAVIWLDADDARARAEAATQAVVDNDAGELPPFHGVPLPIKDLAPVAGWPSFWGSAAGSEDPVDETSTTVARFVDAGFVLCGRTNSPEFGTVTATENARFGITRNPWHLGHTSGGSSGGASSVVAGGIFPIAHASDGGGSIRIPATCTGLVGLKPSRGRVPDTTVGWEGASTNGVVSHTVADTAAVLDVVGRPDPLAWWSAPPPHRPFAAEVGADPGRLRVAVSTSPALSFPSDPECVAAVDETVAALADAGHEIVDAEFDPHVEPFVTNFLNVVNGGLSDYPVDWERVQPHNRLGHEQGERIDSLTYTASVAALQRWTRTVNAQWGAAFDLLVTPTMPIQPAPAGQVTDEITASPETTSPIVLQSILFTSMFNMNGLPAISLPVRQASDSGLPIGVQLVGGPWQDDLVLRVAAQVERALPWSARRAPFPFRD